MGRIAAPKPRRGALAYHASPLHGSHCSRSARRRTRIATCGIDAEAKTGAACLRLSAPPFRARCSHFASFPRATPWAIESAPLQGSQTLAVGTPAQDNGARVARAEEAKGRMCRFQFSLRTLFIVTAACGLLLGWWVPSGDEVRYAGIYFCYWRPDLAALRVTRAEEFFGLFERDPRGGLYSAEYWPDFSKSDVIPVPLNGLAGEPTAEYRIEALGKPVRLDFHNKPLRDVVDALADGHSIDLPMDRRALWENGLAVDMPITFHCEGVPLREALHSMLEPHGLTFAVWDGAVCITTPREAQRARAPPLVYSGGYMLYYFLPPRHRLRMHGKLVFITSFADAIDPDSGANGYTVPKGAKVLFVSERVANAINIGYTAGVLMLAVALIVYLRSRSRRRPAT